MKRIFLSGPSGSGKTTLATYISNQYGIPFIQGSSKVLWPEFGIKSHADLINKTFSDKEFGINFQHRLLAYRNEQIANVNEFVTDRSPLDNLLYYMLQVSHMVDTEENLKYIEACRNSYPEKSTQILLSIKYANLEDDNMRVNNKIYQMFTEASFHYLLKVGYFESMLRGPSVHFIEDWNFNKRKYRVEKIMKRL